MKNKGISIITLDTMIMLIFACFLLSLTFNKTTSFDETTVLYNAKAKAFLCKMERSSLPLTLIWTKGRTINVAKSFLASPQDRIRIVFDGSVAGEVGALYGEGYDILYAYGENHLIKVEAGP